MCPYFQNITHKEKRKRGLVFPSFLAVLIFSINTPTVALKVSVTSGATHWIPVEQRNVDAKNLNVRPGDTIKLESGLRQSLRIINVRGDSLANVIICNGDGEVIIQNNDFHYGVVLSDCSYFRFTGSHDNSPVHGIRILGTGQGGNGLSVEMKSTNYELDHIEIAHTGFAGIMAQTHPTCDLLSNRQHFTQFNTIIRDNFIYNTYGEGIYIGHSFYNGYTVYCDGQEQVLFPHEIKGLKVYNNRIENTGYDGIQIGCAVEDTEVYANNILNYGVQMESMQHSGIQIGAGTKIRCYGNFIANGYGNGIVMFGLPDSYIYNNLIVNAGKNYHPEDPAMRIHGIFVDDRDYTQTLSNYILNNTIINPKSDGIRFFSTVTRNNLIANNFIINPGSHYLYDPVSYKFINIKKNVDVMLENNYFSDYFPTDINAEDINCIYNIFESYPLQNKGIDVSSYRILDDFHGNPRGVYPSVGCFEYTGGILSPFVNSAQVRFSYQPSSGEIGIENITKGNMTCVRVTDLTGRTMLERRIDEPFFYRIKISDLKSGNYYVVSVEKVNGRSTGFISSFP